LCIILGELKPQQFVKIDSWKFFFIVLAMLLLNARGESTEYNSCYVDQEVQSLWS